MTPTPMTIETRPFAVEPLTNVMLPDGIFDNALYNLNISCHYTNTSGTDLSNVTIYLESAGDPGIAVTARTYTFDVVPAGASLLVSWAANFQSASPGKPLISFIAQADGHAPARVLKQIFVTQTRYDAAAQKWTCTIPEGRLEVTGIYAIPPGHDWAGSKELRYPGPSAPTGIKFTWYPGSPFAGQFGDLPFSDPWWKVIALIVAVVAALVGVIAAAVGGGTFFPGVRGKFEEDPSAPNVQCCTPNPGGSVSNDATTVAGVCGVICSVAIAVACSDAADPVYRGEQNTFPAHNELTVSETVEAHWTFADPPNAGVPYATHVQWRYDRATTGGSYSYEVDEEQVNIHVLDHVEIDTPKTVPHRNGPLWVTAKFEKPDGTLFTGPDLYTFCFFRSPGPKGLFFREPLLDDGRGLDATAGDGVYTAALDLAAAQKALTEAGAPVQGVWQVFVYAQDVNRTMPGTPPVIAAQTVAGNFVASAVSITFDPTQPCPLKAQASITVT